MLFILISGSQMRTPRFVRVMHPNPKLNFDINEPDYGLLSKLTISSPRLIRCLFFSKDDGVPASGSDDAAAAVLARHPAAAMLVLAAAH